MVGWRGVLGRILRGRGEWEGGGGGGEEVVGLELAGGGLGAMEGV